MKGIRKFQWITEYGIVIFLNEINEKNLIIIDCILWLTIVMRQKWYLGEITQRSLGKFCALISCVVGVKNFNSTSFENHFLNSHLKDDVCCRRNSSETIQFLCKVIKKLYLIR